MLKQVLKYLGIGAGIAAVAAAVFFVGVVYGTVTDIMRTPPVIVCEEFALGVQDQFGIMYLGHIELCGENLEWGNVILPAPSVPQGSLQ